MSNLAKVPVSLTTIDSAFGWKPPSGGIVGLRDAVLQLQGLQIGKCEGAGQSTAVSLERAGGGTKANRIATTDIILAAIQFVSAAASGFDRLSLRNDVKCVSEGNVAFSAATTAGSQIVVFWYDLDGYSTGAAV